MDVFLEKATERDALPIFHIQLEAFMPLLEKYRDFDANPANENIEKVLARINKHNGGFYKILVDKQLVGAICISQKETGQFWISPMFILPTHQGKGIAQKAMKLAEELFPEATTWELATLLEEERNCYLYEKVGYRKTGVSKKLNDKATLIYYKKVL